MGAKPGSEIGAVHERERPQIDMILARLEIRDRVGARAGFLREDELIGARAAGQRVVMAGRENDVLAGRAGQGDVRSRATLVEDEMDPVGVAKTVGDGQGDRVGLRLRTVGIVDNAIVQRRIDRRDARARTCRGLTLLPTSPVAADTVNVSVDAVASASVTWSPEILVTPLPSSVTVNASVPITGPGRGGGRRIRSTDERHGQRLASGTGHDRR